MFKEITKLIFAVIQNPKFIELAKNISSVQVVENETHIAFFLSKIKSEDSQIILNLKELMPEAVILTTNDGKPLLNITLTPQLISMVEGEPHGGK